MIKAGLAAIWLMLVVIVLILENEFDLSVNTENIEVMVVTFLSSIAFGIMLLQDTSFAFWKQK